MFIHQCINYYSISSMYSLLPWELYALILCLCLQKLCNETSCKEGLMVAQHTLVTDPSRRTHFIQVLVEVMSGSDKSRLITALNSAPHLSAALLRLLGVKVVSYSYS